MDLNSSQNPGKRGGKIIYLYSVNKLGSPSSYRHGEYTSESRYDARTRYIIDAIDILKNK